jgi:ADP-ribosylglycohydrolase
VLPPVGALRVRLRDVLSSKAEQGFDIEDLPTVLDRAPDSYDAMADISARTQALRLRPDWDFVEPLGYDGILAECDPGRLTSELGTIDREVLQDKIEAAFLGAVCGCILGKPVEMNPSLAEIQSAAAMVGEWPIDDYVSEDLLAALGRRHPDWDSSSRGRITRVPPDDDINYTIIGAMLLEQHGARFNRGDVISLWQRNVPFGWSWGPERVVNVKAGMNSLVPGGDPDFADWVGSFNPGVERCGALIRVAAYGYAAAGRPELAARLAYQDASLTHQRTGVYGAMFVAAAIASAFVVESPIAIFETALRYVPQRSRLAKAVRQSIDIVASAADWEQAYERLHTTFQRFDHCLVYQELGTVVNTLQFAPNTGRGICIQISQGNDTDSYGAIAGSLLGARYGGAGLEDRWIEPFGDQIETTVATFHEHSLSALAKRMGRLPDTVRDDISFDRP